MPWHIDADAAATAICSADSFNVWLPLAEVGNTAPSLEFVLGSHLRMRELPLLGLDIEQRYRSDDWVAATVAAGERWTPVLEPGDAVLFDQYVLHRTQQSPVNNPVRDSCEFRFMNVPQSWLRFARPIIAAQAKRVVRRLSMTGSAA